MRLIVATKNKHKFREIKNILSGIKLPIVYLNQLDKKFYIKENGKNFFENAFKKALYVSKIYRDDLVVGEDSGLVIDYLCGEPGIFSKRYTGKNATDKKNNLKVLRKLEGVELKNRKAYFICSIALLKNAKLIKKIESKLNGFISQEIKGKNGFGYDPIFYLPRYKKTLAELSLQEKNRISHRGRAFCKLKEYLLIYNLGRLKK